MIEGVGLQIEEQIKRQDYRFIKLYWLFVSFFR